MRKRRILLESVLEEVVVYNKERARVSFTIPLSSISTPIYVPARGGSAFGGKEQPLTLDVPSVSEE